MPFQKTQEDTSGTGHQGRVPAEIEALGLSAAEIMTLKTQGTAIRERRGSGFVFRLRFRMHGRLRTKYVGTDENHANLVKQQLEQLQQRRRVHKQLREIDEASRAFRRDSKKRLKPFLASAGLKFHGNTIRRTRIPKGPSTGS